MLSIGKLRKGQELYYEDVAAGNLAAYYAGEGEAPGVWVGALCKDLGLTGMVGAGELTQMMEGDRPGTGERLRGGQEVKIAGFDFTWSAPKSISLLSVLAPPEVRVQVLEWHDEAYRVGFAYLEETAARVRRGHGGYIMQSPGGLLAAAYRHRAARPLPDNPSVQDPHVHTHVVAANMAPGEDGRWTALDHPLFFKAAQTAGYLYQAHLRALVREGLGLEWGEVRKGMAELADFDPLVLREFSRRTAWLEEKAWLGPVFAHIGGREKRVSKVPHRDWKHHEEEVRARAGEWGLDQKTLDKMLDAGRRRVAKERGVTVERDLAELFESMSGEEGLTEKRNTFTERDVLRALAQDAGQGAKIDVLRGDARSYAGRPDVLHTENNRMTVTNLTRVEERLVAAAETGKNLGVAQLPVDACTATDRTLNHDQRLALESVVTSGHGFQVIEALAGSGKTFTAGAIREVYEAHGFVVIGAAPTGRARTELRDKAGIESRTLHGWAYRFATGERLPHGCVVLLDEASMAGTRLTARLVDEVRRAEGKLIAVGDSGQLHSVDASGWMTAVGRRVGALTLSEVLRQENEREKQVLALMHDRKPKAWMDWAQENGRVSFAEAEEQLAKSIEQWHPMMLEHGVLDVTMITKSNETRDVLNHRARQLVAAAGGLGETWVFGEKEIAVGERVICRENETWELRVDNGTRGIVCEADQDGITIRVDDAKAGDELRRLPVHYVTENVEYAYALTGHGIEGADVKGAVVCALPHDLTQGWAYTALSRSKGVTFLNVISEGEVWKHHEEARREDFAPGEIFEKPTEEDLVKRVLAYMRTPDSEELAIEQLPRAAAASDFATSNEERKPEVPRRRRDDPEWFLAYLNPRRRGTLEQEMGRHAERLRGIGNTELERIADEGQPLLRSLDKGAAASSNRLEREFLEQQAKMVQSERRASEVHRQADGLGWRDRKQRAPLEEIAGRHEKVAALARSEMGRLELQLGRFRSQGRHPDQWLEDHHVQAGLTLAAMRELHSRSRVAGQEVVGVEQDLALDHDLERALNWEQEQLEDEGLSL